MGSQSFPSPYCSLYICSVFSFALCFASSLSRKSRPFVSKRRAASAPAKPARSSLAKACWTGWPAGKRSVSQTSWGVLGQMVCCLIFRLTRFFLLLLLIFPIAFPSYPFLSLRHKPLFHTTLATPLTNPSSTLTRKTYLQPSYCPQTS